MAGEVAVVVGWQIFIDKMKNSPPIISLSFLFYQQCWRIDACFGNAETLLGIRHRVGFHTHTFNTRPTLFIFASRLHHTVRCPFPFSVSLFGEILERSRQRQFRMREKAAAALACCHPPVSRPVPFRPFTSINHLVSFPKNTVDSAAAVISCTIAECLRKRPISIALFRSTNGRASLSVHTL